MAMSDEMAFLIKDLAVSRVERKGLEKPQGHQTRSRSSLSYVLGHEIKRPCAQEKDRDLPAITRRLLLHRTPTKVFC